MDKDRLSLTREHFAHGRYRQAELLLMSLERSRTLTPAERAECANLARRSGHPGLAARFLHRRVNGRNGASPREVAEYAAALAVLGGTQLSERLFDGLDARAEPEALYLHAVALMARWEFDRAVPLLESYLPRAPDEGQSIAARLRLAACRIPRRRGIERPEGRRRAPRRGAQAPPP